MDNTDINVVIKDFNDNIKNTIANSSLPVSIVSLSLHNILNEVDTLYSMACAQALANAAEENPQEFNIFTE